MATTIAPERYAQALKQKLDRQNVMCLSALNAVRQVREEAFIALLGVAPQLAAVEDVRRQFHDITTHIPRLAGVELKVSAVATIWRAANALTLECARADIAHDSRVVTLLAALENACDRYCTEAQRLEQIRDTAAR